MIFFDIGYVIKNLRTAVSSEKKIYIIIGNDTLKKKTTLQLTYLVIKKKKGHCVCFVCKYFF